MGCWCQKGGSSGDSECCPVGKVYYCTQWLLKAGLCSFRSTFIIQKILGHMWHGKNRNKPENKLTIGVLISVSLSICLPVRLSVHLTNSRRQKKVLGWLLWSVALCYYVILISNYSYACCCVQDSSSYSYDDPEITKEMYNMQSILSEKVNSGKTYIWERFPSFH